MITFYGLVFALAFITIFILLKFYFKNNKKDPNLAYSAVVYLILCTLIGARLVYVLYYEPLYFLNSPLKSLYIWEGGLSFHGGLIGAILFGILFCKKHKLNFLEIADLIVIPASLFLSLGKIANFFNSELYGKITNVPWCVKFKEAQGCRHPVQLYESAKNFLLFIFLFYFNQAKKPKKGFLLFSFIFFYTFCRFFIDFFREYDVVYLGLGSGQFLNILTFIISGIFLLVIKKKSD
jgi:phosphatidylglycerol---prolipoprotein diacylglyceryl transferase